MEQCRLEIDPGIAVESDGQLIGHGGLAAEQEHNRPQSERAALRQEPKFGMRSAPSRLSSGAIRHAHSRRPFR
ncbi:MAG: hypothetical protein QGF53_07965, partial [Alphaproteobacteria bacterium]|nr:hypothetical protein [Alphaproteobacteria bacterium]